MSSTNTAVELFSKEAEEALCGAAIGDPAVFVQVGIQPEHFYLKRLGAVWAAVESLYIRQSAIDFVTVAEELGKCGKLEEIGGQAYLAALISNAPSFLNAGEYAEIVREYAQRRQWRDLAQRIAKAAFMTAEPLALEAGAVLAELSGAISGKSTASHVGKFAEAAYNEIERRSKDPQDIWGIPTGFLDFDRITGGLQNGEIMYLTGEPGVGKSILAAQMGYQMAAAGHPGVLYSLEMSGVQVVRRLLSYMTRLSVRDMKLGTLSDEGWPVLTNAVETLIHTPLYVSDSVDWTTATLRADLARHQAEHKIEWFALDYAYLLQDGRNLSENDRTGFISAQMKSICRALDLAGIVIHSLNKEGIGNASAGGKNLRGSGQQFYDADLILHMFHAGNDRPNFVLCAFWKGRELEQPKQGFELMKLSSAPAFVTPMIRAVNVEQVR